MFCSSLVRSKKRKQNNRWSIHPCMCKRRRMTLNFVYGQFKGAEREGGGGESFFFGMAEKNFCRKRKEKVKNTSWCNLQQQKVCCWWVCGFPPSCIVSWEMYFVFAASIQPFTPPQQELNGLSRSECVAGRVFGAKEEVIYTKQQKPIIINVEVFLISPFDCKRRNSHWSKRENLPEICSILAHFLKSGSAKIWILLHVFTCGWNWVHIRNKPVQ